MATNLSNETPFTYNGIHYVSWDRISYQNPDALLAVDDLAGTGANWVGLVVTWYQENASANVIYADPQKTPADAALTYAINELQNRGLKLMLKPHVDGADGSWRGDFDPSDPEAWFASYSAFIMHYAQLGQGLGVDGMVIGTEFVKLSGVVNKANWSSVIAGIRSLFKGVLTYAANATSTADEFAGVSFWDALDLLGLDAYFPLTDHADPTIAELVSAWNTNAQGQNLVEAIRTFDAAYNKPLIFTEIGYRSTTGANMQPWNYTTQADYDAAEQANCYEAFFRVWQQHASWMRGAFWWNWPIPAPSSTDTGYTPRGKPAAQVLADRYAVS